MTVRDDLATLDEYLHVGVPLGADYMFSVRARAIPALSRVEAEIARLEAEAKHGERAWEQMRERAEKAEAEVARLEAEMVPRAFSIAQQEEIMRLRDGLRFYANEDDYLWYGDERGTIQKNDRGAHARTLLADQDGAA